MLHLCAAGSADLCNPPGASRKHLCVRGRGCAITGRQGQARSHPGRRQQQSLISAHMLYTPGTTTATPTAERARGMTCRGRRAVLRAHPAGGQRRRNQAAPQAPAVRSQLCSERQHGKSSAAIQRLNWAANKVRRSQPAPADLGGQLVAGHLAVHECLGRLRSVAAGEAGLGFEHHKPWH